jgi:hypothetical protein
MFRVTKITRLIVSIIGLNQGVYLEELVSVYIHNQDPIYYFSYFKYYWLVLICFLRIFRVLRVKIKHQ